MSPTRHLDGTHHARVKRTLITLTTLCAATADAQSAEALLTGIKTARREIVAILPVLGREDVAVALKAAAKRGTSVYLISERASLRRSGYLLNVSHGAPTIRTYLTSTPITNAWIIVDGSWAATGWGLESPNRPQDVRITTNRIDLSRTLKWASAVTRVPPVSREQIIRWFYGK